MSKFCPSQKGHFSFSAFSFLSNLGGTTAVLGLEMTNAFCFRKIESSVRRNKGSVFYLMFSFGLRGGAGMSWRSKWTNGEREKKGETEMERDMGGVEKKIRGGSLGREGVRRDLICSDKIYKDDRGKKFETDRQTNKHKSKTSQNTRKKYPKQERKRKRYPKQERKRKRTQRKNNVINPRHRSSIINELLISNSLECRGERKLLSSFTRLSLLCPLVLLRSS